LIWLGFSLVFKVPVLKSIFPKWTLAALASATCLAAVGQVLPPPEIAGRAFLLYDMTSSQVLAAKDPDMSVEPASLTKLMTAYLVFDALHNKKIGLTQTLGVSERAWKMPGSRMFIDPKMQVPVEDLLKGMIVQSGNDATVALAEGVGGTVERFVSLMNQQAAALGMKSTQFKNPEGLTEPGHVTTARDLAMLATRLLKDFPEYVPYYSIKHYRYPGTPSSNDTNRNMLLFRDPTVDGLKTGHTNAAGYCLVATARRDVAGLGNGAEGQRRLVSVLLGASSENVRAAESQKLLNWGYSAYEPVRLVQAGQPVIQVPVWKGKSAVVKLGLPQGVVVSVPAGGGRSLKTDVARPDPIVAPLQAGQALGVLKVSQADGTVVAEVPLQVLETVAEAGVLGRAWDAIRLWVK
jgi:D-alanyl-D-alanine carboxypeptidase (penicillin-binding protein 5/6)